MSGWTLFACAAVLGALGLLFADHIRHQHEKTYKERMRRSMLYYEIYALVAEARRHDIDRVQVERSRVVFYGVCPPGKIGEYVLAEHGHRPLNNQRTLALMQALADDVPLLQENRYYRLQRYTVMRPNGQKDHAYQFTIRSGYKTAIMYERQRVWLD